jgi:hypothetical protein
MAQILSALQKMGLAAATRSQSACRAMLGAVTWLSSSAGGGTSHVDLVIRPTRLLSAARSAGVWRGHLTGRVQRGTSQNGYI